MLLSTPMGINPSPSVDTLSLITYPPPYLSSKNPYPDINVHLLCALSVYYPIYLTGMRKTWLLQMGPCVTPEGCKRATTVSSFNRWPVFWSHIGHMD